MINNARGSHSTPGVYMKEVDVAYSTKSLGQTTLGVAGETQKGPAFQPIMVSNWNEFVEYFGETSPEKFLGNDGEAKYLKYELPYVAKSYLKESKQLEVSRALGLSGYNAGPAWVIVGYDTAQINNHISYVLGLLRSKGEYTEPSGSGICEDASGDELKFIVNDITWGEYNDVEWNTNCSTGTSSSSTSQNNPFKKVLTINGKEYPFSMDKNDKDYILNVFGTDPQLGNSPIFVEEFYDVKFEKLKEEGRINRIFVAKINIPDASAILPENTFYDFFESDEKEYDASEEGKMLLKVSDGKKMDIKKAGNVYKASETGEKLDSAAQIKVGDEVYNFTPKNDKNPGSVERVGDISDYKEPFRNSVTPWIVSEVRGNGKKMEVKPLFRIHTISDGNSSNEEIKISIANIRPDQGTFDVLVRDFHDTDNSPVFLESFTKCTMKPNSKDYIAFKIGTIDGSYELKSKYIMIEMNESDEVYNSVPCGFIGYPTRSYGKVNRTGNENYSVRNYIIPYNNSYHYELKPKKQYFGLSDMEGIDIDEFSYKGKDAYVWEGLKLTDGFHLDERLATANRPSGQNPNNIKVSFNNDNSVRFITYNNKNTSFVNPGIISTESNMVGSVYEDVQMRKFTVCTYGGFDGWDIYRKQRSNTNKFRVNNYKGVTIENVRVDAGLDLPVSCNNSDYYAYLAAIRAFSNPEETDINLLATPGINWYDHSALTQDAISMVEDSDNGRGGDVLYVLNAPDTDDAKETIDMLDASGIDSSYVATYWPWVKCYDPLSEVYVNLPVTKDAVRNMAYIDKKSYPWFAPAGLNRGSVDCIRATSVTRQADSDRLYDAMINPVKTFAVDGVKIWGNKTVYSGNTPLNRVNVRRLMNRVKKLISSACRVLIFEPNDSTVRAQFESIVKPILSEVKKERGIYDFKVEVDDSPEAIDAHTLPAKIWIKPTPTLEYIDLTFIITPTGASFED